MNANLHYSYNSNLEENANISAQNPGSSPHRQKKVCKTRECIALSHQLNNFGDKSVDPCVNFYQHACARYTEQLNADTLGLWKTKLVEKVINEYLYKNKNVGTNSTSERIIKQMFGLCLKMENDENEFFETFYRDVWADVQKVGLWPMIDQKFNESTFNLARYLENMSEKLDMAHFGLFKLATYPKTLINEDEGSLDSTSSEEKKQIKSLASFNNFQIDESTLENDIEDVDKLRQKLKKIVDKRNRLRPVDYDEIILKNPLINIETILKKYQSRKRPEIQNFIQENIISIEMFTTQNDSLHQLILDTPPRTMANFLIMRVVQRAFELIDLGPRQSCIAFVIDKMGQAALRIFVRNFFKKENIKLGKELVESIIKAYLKMFENSSWLVQKTKDSAISKMKKMNYIVGYPDEFEAPGALDQLYDELVSCIFNC
uniref:Peptidase_M13_N domain-containing protein n=2 Tax=Caenorhabditis japonica TaxID=281687 RepID=A0A8R1DT62_CAEJA